MSEQIHHPDPASASFRYGVGDIAKADLPTEKAILGFRRGGLQAEQAGDELQAVAEFMLVVLALACFREGTNQDQLFLRPAGCHEDLVRGAASAPCRQSDGPLPLGSAG